MTKNGINLWLWIPGQNPPQIRCQWECVHMIKGIMSHYVKPCTVSRDERVEEFFLSSFFYPYFSPVSNGCSHDSWWQEHCINLHISRPLLFADFSLHFFFLSPSTMANYLSTKHLFMALCIKRSISLFSHNVWFFGFECVWLCVCMKISRVYRVSFVNGFCFSYGNSCMWTFKCIWSVVAIVLLNALGCDWLWTLQK